MIHNRFPPLSIAIPASFTDNTPHLREKTFRIGMIGRASAIFRINEVIIYPDQPSRNQSKDMELISSILSYMETPQYLRKHLFPIKPTLRYVGILPPLRTPNHPLGSRIKNLKVGEYRDGVVVKSSNRGSYIEIGVEKHAYSKKKFLPIGKRVTLKIVDLSQKTPYVLPINSKVVEEYWGYQVSISKLTLTNILKEYDLKIATSKYGEFFTHSYNKLRNHWNEADNVLIVFGSSKEGLHKIIKNEGTELKSITNFIINTIPNQGTETIRTEEAIWATLAVLNEM